MGNNPVLKIIDDSHAFVVKDDVALELKDGIATHVIAMYRHQLTHGTVLADTYLMGVIDGMRQARLLRVEELLADFRHRRERSGQR